MASVGSVRLSKRNTQKEIQNAVKPDNRYTATMPDQTLYGVFGPQLAAMLAASANGAQGQTAKFADRLIVANEAQKEAERYSADLAAANATQAELQRRSEYYNILNSQQDALQGDTELGMGGARGAPVWDENYGVWKTPVDQMRVNVSNADVLNTNQAERFGKYAESAERLRGAGIAIPDQYLGELLTPPTQAEPVQVHSGTTPLTPDDATKQYGTDQGLTFEQQKEIAELKARARANGTEDEIEVSVKTGEGGVSDVTVKGTPEALIANGYDPVTGKKVNPKADAQGGGASAKPAASISGPVNLQQASLIGNEFGRVTSTVRSEKKNKAVGGVPNSYHLKGRAIDIARKKGVTHGEIEAKYKAMGYKLVESIDEGDHSHFAFASGPPRDPAVMYAARVKQNPNVASATPVGDGTVLVVLKNGEQRVYKNGKRVG